MAFNVSGISVYTDQTSQELIKKAIGSGRTLTKVSIVPGVKYKEALTILENTVTINGATCGFSPTGSVAFNQRIIAVTALELKDTVCPKILETMWMGQLMSPGAAKDIELGQIFADSYVEKIKVANEMNMWQGNASASAYTNFDGWVKLMEPTAAGRVTATGALATGHDQTNIIGTVASMSAAIPEDIQDREDLTLFMSYANYDSYTSALIDKNLYNYNIENAMNHETKIPGKNVLVSATKGLSGTGRMILTYNKNLVVGTDMLNEDEKFDIWYSKDNDEVRVNIQWKLGVQVYFPSYVVCNWAAV